MFSFFCKHSAKNCWFDWSTALPPPQELLDWGADATLQCHGGATAYEAARCHAVRRCLARETRWNCLPLRCSSHSLEFWCPTCVDAAQKFLTEESRRGHDSLLTRVKLSPTTDTDNHRDHSEICLSLRILDPFWSMILGNMKLHCRSILYNFKKLLEIFMNLESFMIQARSGSGGTATAWGPEEPRCLLCCCPRNPCEILPHCLPQRVDKPAMTVRRLTRWDV